MGQRVSSVLGMDSSIVREGQGGAGYGHWYGHLGVGGYRGYSGLALREKAVGEMVSYCITSRHHLPLLGLLAVFSRRYRFWACRKIGLGSEFFYPLNAKNMVTLILDGYNVIHGVPELQRRMNQNLEVARAC